ncbi:unnamed protein product [Closterium sp. Yama58-4]|nr:unnamed protein product [Closterium sp. Yama58-4]
MPEDEASVLFGPLSPGASRDEETDSGLFSSMPFRMVALACTCVAILIAFRHMMMHLRYYTEPTHQRYIIRIIFMVPVYAAMSYGALVASDYAMYFKTVRDMYEAWVIYNFLSLCLAWVGGPGAVAISLTGRVLKPSTLLLTCWLPPIPLDGHFIRHCKRGCLQFVFIKPLLAALCLALYSAGRYEEGVFALTNGYPYVTCVYMVSYSLAVYALLFFYFGCHDLLRSFNPIPKFIMIKLVVVLTYWQGIVVFVAGHLGLVRSSSDAADLQSLLLCCEMALAAGGFAWAFPVTPFAAASMGGGGGGIVEEVGGFFQRLRHAAAVGDVVDDTVHQFSPTYHDYVLYSDGSTQAKHFRTRTFVPMDHSHGNSISASSPFFLLLPGLILPLTGREMEAYRKDGKINSIQSPDYILAPPPPLHPFTCKPCATTTSSTTSSTTITSSTAGMAAETAPHMQAGDSFRTASGDPLREVTNSVGSSGGATTAATAIVTVTAPASNMISQLPSNTALLDFLSGNGAGADGMEACEEAQPSLIYRASIPCGSDHSTTLFTSPSDPFSSTPTNHGSSYSSSYGDMQGVARAGELCGESSRWGREGGRRAGLFDKLTDENVYGYAADGGDSGSGGGGVGVSGVLTRGSMDLGLVVDEEDLMEEGDARRELEGVVQR